MYPYKDGYEGRVEEHILRLCRGGGEGDKAAPFCSVMRETSLFEGGGDWRDLVPFMDVPECVGGSVSACAWLALDATPIGRIKALKGIAKGAKGAKGVDSDVMTILKTCKKCFLAGTQVLMADGTTKAIEEVELGDEVLATDPVTGETVAEEVAATIVTDNDKVFVELTVGTPEGPERLTATHEHPFWSVSAKEWVDAEDLTPGTRLRTDDGRTVAVEKVRRYADEARTYNLTITDLHTYYVLAGQTPVLVHNSNCAGAGRDLIGGQEQFHIIHGDRTGGGHKWPGQPGKTVFPRGWDTDKILDSIADVATSPNSVRTQQTGRAGALYTRNGDPSRWKVEGVVDGVNIRVIYEPATDRIVTGFPYRP